MRTFLPALLAFALSLPPTALAQQNPFNIPSGGYSGANAGSSLALSWKPTTDGPVTLVLRSGDATDLQEGTVIACMFVPFYHLPSFLLSLFPLTHTPSQRPQHRQLHLADPALYY